MYGFFHQALTRWMASLPDGEEIIQRVFEGMRVSGCNLDDFFQYFSDDVTISMVNLVAEVTGISIEDIKYEAGMRSIETFTTNGYESVLRTLGDDFFTFLKNLDSLHDNFLPAFPLMSVPQIHPIRNNDDTLSIHYRSAREGWASFMMGAIKASASIMFDLEIDIHHRLKKGQGSDHDVFHVFLDPTVGFPPTTHMDLGKNLSMIALDERMTSVLFPWHFAIDQNLKIFSVGKFLANRMKKDCLGTHVRKSFHLLTPVNCTWNFEELKEMIDKPFLISTIKRNMMSVDEYNAMLDEQERLYEEKLQNLPEQDVGSQLAKEGVSFSKRGSATSSFLAPDVSSPSSNLSTMSDTMDARLRMIKDSASIKLHGQMIYCNCKHVMIFIGTPKLKNYEEMAEQGVRLEELPIYSHGREMLYGNMFQSISSKNSNEIQRRLHMLDASMAEVHETKQKLNKLLNSILPPTVAERLSQGQIPQAETYNNVTVLFSDIAGFTNISSGVPSHEVMTMLHNLFVKFDDLADQHGCYKVETIGDAYMVAAGCPDECEDHAARIAALAIDMVKCSNEVLSPLDGEPLRIRIGIHSGPLMAGVVGRSRPRYCLFGDTVNVASRMESNGLPGCIQVTYRFLRYLPSHHGFLIAPRGHIEIKGKGTMKTFLILGHEDGMDQPLLPTKKDAPELQNKLLLALLKPNKLVSNHLNRSQNALSLFDGSDTDSEPAGDISLRDAFASLMPKIERV